VHVVENYLPRHYVVDPPPIPHAGVVVGWTAFGEREYDMERLGIRETLLRLLKAHPSGSHRSRTYRSTVRART
jgi:hypothetical protein